MAVYCPGRQWGCCPTNSYHVPKKGEGMTVEILFSLWQEKASFLGGISSFLSSKQ